jgi:hypothetical protein
VTIGYHDDVWRWLVLLAGCGRIGFEPAGVRDGAPGDGSSTLLTYLDAVLADQPIAYWRLDDTDATARDVTGNFPATYDGTCMHGATGALTGDPDPATYFNGACTVTASNVPSFTGISAFTIELWLSPGANLGNALVMKETRVGNAVSGAPIDGYTIFVDPLGAYVERVVGQNQYVTTPTMLSSQGFHHLVGTYDGVQLAFYIDGTQVATTPDGRTANATTVPLQIGGWGMPSMGETMGTYDEVAIYDHALAPDRIALHRDLGINGPH